MYLYRSRIPPLSLARLKPSPHDCNQYCYRSSQLCLILHFPPSLFSTPSPLKFIGPVTWCIFQFSKWTPNSFTDPCWNCCFCLECPYSMFNCLLPLFFFFLNWLIHSYSARLSCHLLVPTSHLDVPISFLLYLLYARSCAQ